MEQEVFFGMFRAALWGCRGFSSLCYRFVEGYLYMFV